ncbi:MAG: DNA mismatch repair protein MutS, partial [Flavobacteriales bacterium]|nr:DNA mismatch repair protein MutS [Flavobacteriales bacterium]
VFDNRWQVRDDASPELAAIRSSLVAVRKQVAKNFTRLMRECAGKGVLAETGESYLNDRKVLAVHSHHKRRVSGNILGASKTGSITFIEPEENIDLNIETGRLLEEERAEVHRILQQLTRQLSKHLPYLSSCQDLLTGLDFLQAKVQLARQMDAHCPELVREPEITLRKAYHPLLLLQNKNSGKVTFPQDIEMTTQARMLVISGPNAGGKSITLKTVGLLQLMFQSGLMIPVAQGSRLGFFHAVLTDIGDHQSIENQLSTYSYRLKRMKAFLETANRRSLVLLDEFGTGSDPDLGGALAEVFFEELYSRRCFGVITTHYSNIKLKAAQLKHAINGCMLFNRETLEPVYRLSVGEPGSSFTFEVAEINGIARELIERAKSKLSDGKVKM